jgi:hypothetical protein
VSEVTVGRSEGRTGDASDFPVRIGDPELSKLTSFVGFKAVGAEQEFFISDAIYEESLEKVVVETVSFDNSLGIGERRCLLLSADPVQVRLGFDSLSAARFWVGCVSGVSRRGKYDASNWS